jgi:hypothetical protein
MKIEQPQGGDWPKLGEVIEEYVHKVDLQGKLIWEEHLRLHINVRPKWCPEKLWQKLVCLVVNQSVVRK